MTWLNGITDAMDMNLSKLQETVSDRSPGVLQGPQGHRESDTTEGTKQQQQCMHAS